MGATKIAILLLAPSGAGKDSIIAELEKAKIAVPCLRHTTRLPREGDNGHYEHFSLSEFKKREDRGDYILDHEFAGEMFGTPLETVKGHWAKGEIPVLKGHINWWETARKKLLALDSNAKLLVLQVDTAPYPWWEDVVRLEREPAEATARIWESHEALKATLGSMRGHVDALFFNRRDDLSFVVSNITSFLRGHMID